MFTLTSDLPEIVKLSLSSCRSQHLKTLNASGGIVYKSTATNLESEGRGSMKFRRKRATIVCRWTKKGALKASAANLKHGLHLIMREKRWACVFTSKRTSGELEDGRRSRATTWHHLASPQIIRQYPFMEKEWWWDCPKTLVLQKINDRCQWFRIFRYDTRWEIKKNQAKSSQQGQKKTDRRKFISTNRKDEVSPLCHLAPRSRRGAEKGLTELVTRSWRNPTLALLTLKVWKTPLLMTSVYCLLIINVRFRNCGMSCSTDKYRTKLTNQTVTRGITPQCHQDLLRLLKQGCTPTVLM